MKLIFKQRLFAFDSFDIYDDLGNTVFKVEGKFSFHKHFRIFDASRNLIAHMKQEPFTFFPKFNVYSNGVFIGSITKELTFFKPKYTVDFKSWQINGDLWEWDYTVTDSRGATVATAYKEIFNLSDTYAIDVADEKDAAFVLMIVLAIDADKSQRN